jgi:hypothetical protein
MYGLTRASTSLIAAGVAGLLIWIATGINDHSTGGYWTIHGLIASAGLVMAWSQLLGGWTKWGALRLSATFFLFAFLPVLLAAGWIVVAHQPHGNWARDHVLSWSSGAHIRGLVNDLTNYVSVLAFGVGLVFGYSFDTTGPRQRGAAIDGPQDVVTPADHPASDEPLPAEGTAARTGTRPRTSRFGLGRRRREPVASEGGPVDKPATTPPGPSGV